MSLATAAGHAQPPTDDAGPHPIGAGSKTQTDALLPTLQQQFTQAEAARSEKFDAATTAELATLKAAADADLTSIKTEVASLRESVSSEKTRVDAVAAQQQQQFTAAQEQRSKEFASQRDQISAAAADEHAEQVARAEAHFAEMGRILEETQRVANAVANTGTASAYAKDAAEERGSADFWRWTGIVFALVAAVFAGITLIWRAPDLTTTSYITTGGRLGVTVALGAIATYATRQSGQHRARQQRSRQLELELTAFGPFIEGLDDTTKRELRADYARRLFRGYETTSGPAPQDDGLVGPGSVSVAGQVTDTITSVMGRK